MHTGTMTKGQVIADELMCTWAPKFPPTPKLGGVMMVHGAGSNATYPLDSYGKQNERLAAVVDAGFTVTSADNGGSQTWGNQRSIDALDRAYGHTVSQKGATGSKVAIMGDSMGGVVALGWAAQNRDKVSCFIGTIPVISIHDIVSNDRGGYGSLASAAYDGWDAADRQGYDLSLSGGARTPLRGLPMLIFYGTNDTICVPSVTEAFKTAMGSSCTLVPMPLGHEEAAYSTPDRTRIVDFLKQYNTPA